MEPLDTRTEPSCPACDRPVASPGTLCSAACLRAAVHEIEDLSLRRRRLAEDLEAREGRSTLERLDPRNRDGGALRAEHDRVAARTNQLMAALLATDRGVLAGHASPAGHAATPATPAPPRPPEW